ncbi:unnamed protein product [Rhizophagus irregularis]|uniref:Uncharacterized protein n=1 Tax=Rhizophagus irregularis TaxID=588596 RepID=A0A916ECH8_9GLOM|nr:unnamed protein product [Rhizophagus irregularis]CAB5380154.1 unnamed protein product [Rhizophagus irregularis]
MTDAENLHHICDRISCGNGLSSFRPSDAREFWLLFRWPKNALKFDGFLDLLSGFRRIFQAGLNPLEYLDLPPTGLRTRGKLDFGAFDAFEFEILYLKFGTPIWVSEGEKG